VLVKLLEERSFTLERSQELLEGIKLSPTVHPKIICGSDNLYMLLENVPRTKLEESLSLVTSNPEIKKLISKVLDSFYAAQDHIRVLNKTIESSVPVKYTGEACTLVTKVCFEIINFDDPRKFFGYAWSSNNIKIVHVAYKYEILEIPNPTNIVKKKILNEPDLKDM